MPKVYKELKLGSYESLDAHGKSLMFCGKLLTRVDNKSGFSLRLSQSHYVEKLVKVSYQQVLETRNHNERLA